LRSLDRRLLRVARTCGHSDGAERAVARFSKLGQYGGVWLVLGVGKSVALRSTIFRQNDSVTVRVPRSASASDWQRATATVAGAYALNTLVKLVVRRPRPTLPGLPPLTSTPTQLSFPSAHATTSFAAALAYSRLDAPAVPLYTLAFGLALSRLYLGVHYPSDVLAGAVLGTAIAACCVPAHPGVSR
jgi:membrane-associated phospholipid phosphatase